MQVGVLHMLKSATDTICESFILETEGKVMVIDGGFESEAETLYAKLRELGGHVDAWFFTHPHDDHYGAFCRMLEDRGDEIGVDAVYSNFPGMKWLCEYDYPEAVQYTKKYIPWMERLTERLGIRSITMHRGDCYRLGGAEIHVLREPDLTITENCINNSSTVFRVDINGKRMLFLGDLAVEGGRQLLETVPQEELRAYIVQMAHHGQDGVERDVYEAVRARCCLWCTPTWLWDNMGAEGYDSGNYKTVIVRGWMSEIGVRKHYVNKDGPFAIEL